MTAEVMAQAVGGRRAGSAWMARCPAHDDRVPSLAIDERSDGTVLVCCHAGCSQHAVINALTARGLWPGVSGRSLAQVPVPPRQRTDREPPPSRTRVGAAMSIWHRSEPAAGTLVKTYLRTRGITLPPPKVLNHHASDAVKHRKTWPSIPRTLSSRLRRAATFLRTVEIHIDFDQKVGRRRTRMITISTGPDHQAQPASAASAPAPLSEVSGACGNSTRGTVERHEDAANPGADGQHTPESPWKRAGTDSRNAADATDEHIPPQFCRREGQAVTAPDGVPEDPGRMDEGHLP